jgi:hypothetical protein
MKALVDYFRKRKISFYSYLGIAAAVCVSKAVIMMSDLKHPLATNSTLHWSHILLILAAGFVVMIYAPYGEIESSREGYRDIRRWLYLPVLLGVLFGVYEIGKSLILHYPDFHVRFPYSIPVYVAGGTLYEIKYHLVPIVAASILLLWLFKKRHAVLIFWILALALSIYEPYKQVTSMVNWKIISGPFWIAESALGIFVANMVPFYFLKKHGFVSMLAMRLTTYVVWHIIWPPLYFG